MFVLRELNRCLVQKQLLLQKSEFNRSLLTSEALGIRQQTERWAAAGAALVQKIGSLNSSILPLFFARRSRLVRSAFAIAQAVVDFWPKRRDAVTTANGIPLDSRLRNAGTVHEPSKNSSADERSNPQAV